MCVVTVTNEKAMVPSGPVRSWQSIWLIMAWKLCWTPSTLLAAASAPSLSSYVTSNNADILVMGAYGHTRIRDFILGGATKSMLSKPLLPIFLSH